MAALSVLGLMVTGAAFAGTGTWQTIGAGGRQVSLVAVAPSDPQVLYITVPGSGYDISLHRSRDGGQTWEMLLPDNCCGRIIVDPRDPDTIYASMHDWTGSGFKGLRKSTDGGKSWVDIGSGLVFNLWFSPDDPDWILHQRDLKLYESRDGGLTWEDEPIFEGTIQDVEFDPHDPDTVYVVLGYAIVKSTDRGHSWGYITPLPITRYFDGLLVDPQIPDTLYAWDPVSMIKSVDGGRHWVVHRIFSPAEYQPREMIGSPVDGKHFFARMDPGGWARSYDAGLTWNFLRSNLPSGEGRFVLEPGTPERYWFATEIGLFTRTAIEPYWTARNRGFAKSEEVLAVVPGHPDWLYAVGSEDLLRTRDGGANWLRVGIEGLPLAVAPHPDDPLKAWLAISVPSTSTYGDQTEIYLTSDGGVTWKRVDRSKPDPFQLSRLIIDRSDSRILYGSGHGGVFRSSDSGGTWTRLLQREQLFSILTQTPSGAIYAGGSSLPLFRSIDGGGTWQQLTDETGTVSQLAIDPRDESTLYAHVWPAEFRRSRDGGVNWEVMHPWGGIEAPHQIGDLLADPVEEGVLYATKSGGGVCISRDGGRTWALLDPDWPFPGQPTRFLLAPGNRLYVSNGSGNAGMLDLGNQLDFLFPQLGDGEVAGGGRLQSTLQLVNRSAATDARIRFFDNDGQPMPVALGGSPPSAEHVVHLERGQSFSGTTPGSGEPNLGYVRVSGGPGLAGALVYAYSQNGRLQFQAGVPSAGRMNELALLVDYSEGEDNGVALVNTGDGAADPTAILLDAEGGRVAERKLSAIAGSGRLEPGAHMAKYVSEIFPEIAGQSFSGQLRIAGTEPLSPASLRQIGRPYDDSRPEVWSISTFPAIRTRTFDLGTFVRMPCCDLSSSLIFPHVVDGSEGGLTVRTSLRLARLQPDAGQFVVSFVTADGELMDVEVEENDLIEFHPEMRGWLCQVGPDGRLTLKTRGTGPVKVGYAIVSSGRVTGTAFFSWTQDGVELFETGVPPAEPLTNFTVLFDSVPGLIETAIAMTSDYTREPNVTFRLYDRAGKLRATKHFDNYLPRAPEPNPHSFHQQKARFIHEIFPEVHSQGIPGGIVTVECDQPVHAMTLRQHDDAQIEFPDDLYLITAFPVIPGRHDR